MKKLKAGFLTIPALMVMLAACGNEDMNTEGQNDVEATDELETEGSGDTDEDMENGSETASGEDMSAEEVLSQSIEEMSQLNSYRVEMDMNHSVEFDGIERPMDMEMTMDVFLDPISFAQTMIMPDPISDGDMEVEQYMDEDGTIYRLYPENDQWVMTDSSEFEDFDMPLQEQLDMFQEFSDEMTIEEEGDYYALTVEGSDEAFADLASVFATMPAVPQMQEDMDELFEQMEINDFDYVMYINQDTFYQEEMEMTLEMEMQEGDETTTLSQNIHGIFSEFDNIDQMEIPQEAIDNAEDMEDIEAGM